MARFIGEMTTMAWSKPARSASTRAWWITGSSPSGRSSFGIARESGRNLVPSPAAGITARIIGTSCGNQRAEARLLGLAQLVAEAPGRNIDVGIADHLVLADVAAQDAPFGQAHRKEALLGNDIGVFTLSVGQEATDAVEHLATAEVGLGGRDHVDDRSRDRRQHRVVEEDSAGHRGRHFEMTEVIGDVEAVERAFAEPVQI